MTNKQLLILGTIVLGAAVGVWFGPQFCDWHDRLARSRLIDWGHFERIKTGMPREEVEAILGGSAGNFTTRIWTWGTRRDAGELIYFEPLCDDWTGDRGRIEVRFDDHGAAQEMCFWMRRWDLLDGHQQFELYTPPLP